MTWRRSSLSWPRLMSRYRAWMATTGGHHVRAVPRAPGLDRFDGMWVAVLDGQVIQAALTSHQLALQLHDMDHRKRQRVVVEYVRPVSDSYIVGVGQGPLAGRLHPFPWREEESLTFGARVLRPTVDVELSSAGLQITTKALIDTGSPRCVFPRGVGDLLGVEFPRYTSEAHKRIRLMGREWAAVTETVTLTLRPFDDLAWDADIDFVMDEGLPFALLGYEGFLNRWAVSFNGYLGYLIVEPADHFDARQPPEVLQQLRSRWPDLFQ